METYQEIKSFACVYFALDAVGDLSVHWWVLLNLCYLVIDKRCHLLGLRPYLANSLVGVSNGIIRCKAVKGEKTTE